MASQGQHRIRILGNSLRTATTALAIAIVLSLTLAAIPGAQAQTYTVLYTFNGEGDGANPNAGVVLDRAGNLYGTTHSGGYTGDDCSSGCGTVFKLSHKGSGWTLSTLYSFQELNNGDGYSPSSRVLIDPYGNLYGATPNGGSNSSYCPSWGCGTAFKLAPPATACKTAPCAWTETGLYRFMGGSDGANPLSGVVG